MSTQVQLGRPPGLCWGQYLSSGLGFFIHQEILAEATEKLRLSPGQSTEALGQEVVLGWLPAVPSQLLEETRLERFVGVPARPLATASPGGQVLFRNTLET